VNNQPENTCRRKTGLITQIKAEAIAIARVRCGTISHNLQRSCDLGDVGDGEGLIAFILQMTFITRWLVLNDFSSAHIDH